MDWPDAAYRLAISLAVASPVLLAWSVALAAGARLVRANLLAGAALMAAALTQLVVALVHLGLGPVERAVIFSGGYDSDGIQLYFAAKYVVYGLMDVMPWALVLVAVFAGRTARVTDPSAAVAPRA